jgi:hypothetical protein
MCGRRWARDHETPDAEGTTRMPLDDLSLSEARRIALAAQGFDRPRPGGWVHARHLDRTIRRDLARTLAALVP